MTSLQRMPSTEAALNGYWYAHHVVEEKTKESPFPFEGIGYFTWDASSKTLLLSWHDNFGGRALQTSSGWQGDALVLTGDMTLMGQTVKTRDTIAKKDGGFVHTGEIQDQKGAWVKIAEDTCNK